MRVQIPKHKGITGEFMDALVIRLGIVTDVSGGSRKPVIRVTGQAEHLPEQAVQNIMHISRQRNRRAGKNPPQKRPAGSQPASRNSFSSIV